MNFLNQDHPYEFMKGIEETDLPWRRRGRLVGKSLEPEVTTWGFRLRWPQVEDGT